MSIFCRVLLAAALLFASIVGGHMACSPLLLLVLGRWLTPLPNRLKTYTLLYVTGSLCLSVLVNVLYYALANHTPIWPPLSVVLRLCGVCLWVDTPPSVTAASLLSSLILCVVSCALPRRWTALRRPKGSNLLYGWAFCIVALLAAAWAPSLPGLLLLLLFYIANRSLLLGKTLLFTFLRVAATGVLLLACFFHNIHIAVGSVPEVVDAVANTYLWDPRAPLWRSCLLLTQLVCLCALVVISSCFLPPVAEAEQTSLLSNRSSASRRRPSHTWREERETSLATGGNDNCDVCVQLAILLTGAAFIVFLPTVASLTLVPLVVQAAGGTFPNTLRALVPTALVLGLAMMLQYVCLFPLLRESWLALLFLQPGDAVLAYVQFSISTLLFLSYAIVHTVFRRGVFRKREALNDSRAVTAENSMIRRREDSEHTDEGAASGAVLGEERTADIHAFAEQVRRLQSEADRDALFTQCVGRLPYGPERNRLTGGVVVQDELCAACATTAASLWRRAVLLLRHLLYLVYYPTVLLALLLGGTWTTTTDLLHALLLALLVVYFVKPDWIIVRPHLASLSVASVGLVLVVYNYVLAFLPEEPEYLPGTSIPLSVLGLKKLSHRWDAWFYFLGFISLTVLQRVVNGQCLSWGAVLRRKELREFQNSSLLQSWVPWATATLALVSAAVTAAVSFHSMFVSGFLLGTLSLLVTVSYGNARVIRVCRLVCGVYGVIIAFVTTVSQLPFVRASLLAWVEAYLPYCGDALSAVQCGKEIGFLTHPNTGWLLPQLAPWYITTGLVLSVHPLTFRVIPTEKFARDMPLQRALSFVFKTTEYYCGGLVMFLAYGSIFLSWVSLSFPAREDVCALHLVYLVLFLFDAAPCVVWPYAYLHCAVLFVYQLRWVPAIPFAIPYGTEGNTLPLSTLLGLQKQEGDTSALVTAGWPIAVLLLTLIRRTLFSKRNHQLLSVVSVCLLFGAFEFVLLSLLIGLYYTQYSSLGAMTLVLLVVLFGGGRIKFLEKRFSSLCGLVGVSITLLCVTVLHFFNAHITTNNVKGRHSWEYWGLAPDDNMDAFYLCLFAAMCFQHSVRRHRDSILAASGALDLHAYNGVTSCIDWVRSQLPKGECLSSLSLEVFQQVVPSLPEECTHSWYYRWNLYFTYCMASVCPLAVATLVSGMLLTPSIVNALLTLGGILLVSYVEYLHLHFYSLWRPIATLFLLLPVLSVVSHLPWMHHLFSKSEAWASTILGFDDNYYFSLEGEHVVVLFLVFLQTKLYNSFIYGNILQNLYFEVIERQRRFNERQLRLKKENEAALQAARDYEKVLHARIAQLREGRTSPTGASPPPSSPPTTARRKESAGDVVRVAVQECALLLASHTYEPVVLKAHVLQHSSDLSSSLRTLGFVFKKFLEHHTVTLVVLSALLNALLTGCAYELGALLYILAVPLAYNPYAPRATYQFLLLYITTGILLKTVVQLVLVEHPPSELASMILSRLLVRVSSVGEEDGGEERETKFSFGMDYITFIAVVFHQFICVSNGVYNNDDVDRQLREETEPLPPNDELEMVDNSEDDVVSVEDDESDLSVRIAAEEAKAYLHCTTRFAKSVSDYWSNLISVCGVGEEVYVWYTLLNMISIVVVVVGYGNMAGGHSVTIQENVENNLLPAKMVLMVTVAVALLVVERALYVRRLQSAKVILNIVVYVAYCTVYWVWRYGAPSSLVFGNILFLVKVAEVYFSVLQVRKGFPLHRRPDPFSTRPQVQFLTWCYSLFRAIPFLWECRTLLDWSLEHTSLELNEYLKVEDVYDHVYRRRVDVCAGASRQPPRTLGSPVQPSSKWSAGVTRAGLILLALLAPLWYYSSLNPSVSSNEVRQAKFSLSFDGFSPFFTASLDHTMPLPESWPTWIVRTRPSLTSYGIEQKEKKVQLAQFSTCGSDVWRISPDLFNEMQRKLELVANESATVSIVQEIEVVRTASAASSSLTQLTSTQWPVTASTAADLLNLLVNHTFHRPVELLWFYTPFVLNRPSSVGFYPRSSDPLNYVNCSLQLRQARDPLLGQRVLYWCSTCDPLFTRGNIPREKDNYAEWSCLTSGIGCKAFNYDESAPVYNTTDATPMYLVFLSDNVVVGLSFLNKFGLVALYTTFVLAFGRLLRSMMTGKAQQVVLSDMTDPIPLLQVIQCIQTAREAGELVVEHRVYLDLIDLLRSPERLLTVTGLKSNSYGETTEVAVEATAERPQTDQANRE